MRAWLIANRYAVSAVALVVLCTVGLALVVQPQACASPAHSSNTPRPEPTLQPVVDVSPQPTATAPQPTTVAAEALASGSTPGPASKNYTGEAQPPALDAAGLGHAGTALLACGAGGNLDWSTSASTFQVVCQCTLTLPSDGWAFLSAGGSLSGRTCEYEAQFRLGIDSTEGDSATDRWVNIYGDAGDGMDAVLAVSALRPLKAGRHTFYLLGRRAGGTGTVLLHDPSLAVIAQPAAER